MASTANPTFTPAEAAALVGLPAKRVHKEIEKRVIEADSPPRLDFSALVYLRALTLVDIELPVRTRLGIYRRLRDELARTQPADTIEIARLLSLQIGDIRADLADKIERFERWRERLVTSDEIMGGETVFPGTRLTVRRVGELLERGGTPETIVEDYPNLTAEDLEQARLFVRAYPRVGRPPSPARRRGPLAVGRKPARSRGRPRRRARA